MSANTHPFQKWMEDNGVVDVRFYPSNPSESTAMALLDGAYEGVMAYESGNSVPYEDNTPERHVAD